MTQLKKNTSEALILEQQPNVVIELTEKNPKTFYHKATIKTSETNMYAINEIFQDLSTAIGGFDLVHAQQSLHVVMRGFMKATNNENNEKWHDYSESMSKLITFAARHYTNCMVLGHEFDLAIDEANKIV